MTDTDVTDIASVADPAMHVAEEAQLARACLVAEGIDEGALRALR